MTILPPKRRAWNAVTMPYGKHRGKFIDEIPPEYLFWVLDQPNTSPSLLHAIRLHLEVDLPETDETPDPTSAAVVLPGLTWRWQDAMRTRFTGDAAALIVVDAGEELLRKECTKYTRKSWPTGGAA
ncbi:MAG: DUF3820 family protein [Gemmataceae bacterium]